MEDKSVMTRVQSVGPESSSEDSSYDSDCIDYITSDYIEDSSINCDVKKGDVSRTVSDTLAQEFSEYISTNIKDESQLQQTDSNYTAKVDFARKLGYREEQVQIALGKLGQAATQNELLAELIQLDVGCSGAVGGLSTSTPPKILLQPAEQPSTQPKLRHIVIDGSNVAMSHGSNKVFSSRGIQICVNYFKERGHQDITVFVPMYRKENSPDEPVSDHKILRELEDEGILVWTPSKTINNRRLVCYDDRYVLKLAADTDGIVVSNDNYRDLAIESSEFKRVVQERTLMYSFVNDRFMPPEDPLGRHGPTLDQFLMEHTNPRTTKQIPCPYGLKCTYGVKCKYFHTTKKVSVSEALRKQAKQTAVKTHSLPILRNSASDNVVKVQCARTKSAVINSNSTSLQVYQPSPSSLSSSPSSSDRDMNLSVNNYHNFHQKSPLSHSNSVGGCSSNSANNSLSNERVNGHRKLTRVPSVNPLTFTPQQQSPISNTLHPPASNHHHPQLSFSEPRNQTFQNSANIFPVTTKQIPCPYGLKCTYGVKCKYFHTTSS